MSYQGTFLEHYTKNYGLLKTLDEYPRTKESLVFREFAKNLSGSGPLISSFNDWYENIFENQIIKQSFTAVDGTQIIFKNPKIFKPVIMVNGKEEILYPQYCRDNNLPYHGRISIECLVIKKNGEEIKTEISEFGYIPIMLGSKLCNLYGKTEEELVELKECITDPYGYFHLNSERSVITQDKKRMSKPLVYIDRDGKLILDYTSCKNGKNGSKIFKMKLGKKWATLKVNDTGEKQNQFNVSKNIPVFMIFKILEDLEPEEAMEKYVMKFIPEKYRRRCINVLESSIIKMKNIEDPVKYLCRKRNRKYSYEKRDEILEEFRTGMLESLFPNVEASNEVEETEIKLNILGHMIIKFVLTILDIVKKDSRDSWVNKRFDTAGTLIKILLGSILNSLMMLCRREIEKYSTNPDYSSFGKILKAKSSTHLKRDFTGSFNGTSWGTKTYGKQKENVSESTKRDTPLNLWSISAKNNNPISQRDKKMEVREIQPSQRDKHCLSETPESVRISLIKYFSSTCRISLDTDENIPLQYIKKDVGNMNQKVNEEICDTILMVNGKFVSMPEKKINLVYCNLKTKTKLLNGKRTGKIPMDIEIYYDDIMKTLHIYTDSSRATSPYFVVNQETNELVIEEIDGWKMTYQELLTSGAIEFLSAKESDDESTLISFSVENFYQVREEIEQMEEGPEKERMKYLKKYTHCNIDPNQLFGVPGMFCPMANKQMGARNTFQASMAKQALGYFNINYHDKFYGRKEGFKRLYRATRCICETDGYFLPKMDIMPAGQTAMVAFLTDPDNQEDSVILSEDFVNSGNLNYFKYIMVHYIQPSFPVGEREYFEKPPPKKNESPEKYDHILENGLPKLDTYVKEGDCLIGKVIRNSKEGTVKNNSLMCGLGEEGYVDRIIFTKEKDRSNTYIKIKLRKQRKYQAGDKLAIRYAQKGTVGRVEKRENMIRVSSGINKGISPDVIFNPLGFPSRQTVGLLIEGLVTKAAVYSGTRVDVSAFRNVDTDGATKFLEEIGFDGHGYEEFEFPNGEKLKNKICFVPIYEQVLRHQVLDKIQMRSSGVKSLYTHQPKGGRSQRGGQKIGEMEKDSFVAHGASGVIVERLMKVSDEFKLVICQNCGIIINNKNCTLCDNSQPGILTIPYVFKLLIHLMNGVGLDIRLLTKEKEITNE